MGLRLLTCGIFVAALLCYIIALLRQKRAEDRLLGELEQKLSTQQITTAILMQTSARREEQPACQAPTGNCE